MAEVTLSSAVRNNLLSLQSTADTLGETQERLATGLKVNSALDDPNAFFTASSLNSRGSDLSRLLDSVGLAVQTIKSADEGIKAITSLVENAQAAARQALESTSTTASVTGTVTGLTTSTDLVGTTAITDNDTLSITVGGAAAVDVTLTAAGINTTQEVIDEVNNNVANASARLDSNGSLVIEATNGADLTIGGNNSARAATELGLSTTTVTGTVNSTRTAQASSFDSLRTQINQLATDASFNGNNLLSGDNLSVIFNEDGSSTLSITGVTFNATGLGVSASTNNFQDDTSINAALTELDSAIATLRSQASTFGSNLSVVEVRQDFTKSLITALESGAADLTLADTNLEGANLLALQTRQQLSSTALSLASQADQNVLRLIG